jgi:MoxR-like ATPase
MSLRELVREVPIATHVRDLASHIVLATHPQWEQAPEISRRFVRYGASPRGAQALVLGAKVKALSEGRYNVSVEDLRAMALPALRHRLILNFEGEAEGVDVDRLIGQVVEEAERLVGSQKEVFLR